MSAGKIKITGITSATQEFFEDWTAGRLAATGTEKHIDFIPEAKVLYIYTNASVRIAFNINSPYFDMIASDSPLIVPIVCSKLYYKTYSGTATIRYLVLR